MFGDPAVIVLEAVDVIFPSSTIHPHVEELRVGVTFFYFVNSCTLLLSIPLHHGKGDHLPFKSSTEVFLSGRERPIFLGQVKLEDDKEGGMHQHLSVGEEVSAPFGQLSTRVTQFVIESLTRLSMVRWFLPSFLNNLSEPGNAGPKVLELERARTTRAAVVGKHEGTVVR